MQAIQATTITTNQQDRLPEVSVFVFGGDQGLLMTLGAYFDESVRENVAADPIAVGGYIFKPTAYKQFARKWKRMLRGAGISAMHMTDLIAGQQEFRGLSMARRAELLSEAVAITKTHMLNGLCVMFHQDEFEAMAPPGWPRVLGSIYTGACQMCLRVTALQMDQRAWNYPILYVFEKGYKFEHEADALLRATGQDPGLSRLYRYRNHLFEDKRNSYGLQAADMLAWICTKFQAIAGGQATVPRPFRAPIRTLAEGDDRRYQIQLFTGDKLGRFFDEQSASGLGHVTTTPPPRTRTFR